MFSSFTTLEIYGNIVRGMDVFQTISSSLEITHFWLIFSLKPRKDPWRNGNMPYKQLLKVKVQDFLVGLDQEEEPRPYLK